MSYLAGEPAPDPRGPPGRREGAHRPGAPGRGRAGLGQPGPRDPQPPGRHLGVRPGPAGRSSASTPSRGSSWTSSSRSRSGSPRAWSSSWISPCRQNRSSPSINLPDHPGRDGEDAPGAEASSTAKVEVTGNFRGRDRPLLRQRRPVQAGLLEPHQERRQGHARGRAADASISPSREEGGPDPRRRHGPGHDRRRTRSTSSSLSTRGFEDGRGLGMSIVRKIVDDYDGRIDVRSEPSKGTRGPDHAPDGARPAGGERARPWTTILIIDDEKSLLDLLTVVFKKEGYAVKTDPVGAPGPSRSWRRRTSTWSSPTSRCPGPTAWTSSAMPGRTAPDLPVILITAYGSIDQAVEALKAGALDYVVKPFDVEELKIIVARGLDARRLKQENILLKRDLKDRYSFEQDDRQEPGHAGDLHPHREGGLDGLDRPRHRRERDGQGDGRPGHPRSRAPGATTPSSPSTAPPFPRTSSRASSSATSGARSPGPSPTRRACSRWPSGARSSSTRSGRCRPGRRSSSSGPSRSGRSAGSAARTRSPWTSASSPPPTRT